MKLLCKSSLLLILIALSACTQPGKTTAIAASGGGLLGAGLGAVVGNQTGSATGGLAIGALAGSLAGAAVGNALEGQEQRVQVQQEVLVRQEQLLKAQQAELQQLHGADDSSGPRAMLNLKLPPADKFPRAQRRIVSTPQAIATTPQLARSAAPMIQHTAEAVAIKEESLTPSVEPLKVVQPTVNSDTSNSKECQEAASELSKGAAAAENSDRLFHYRRALRLCPSSPAYHNQLGEFYQSVGLPQDAEFEFQEALKLDPSFKAAQDNLALIK